MAGGPEDLAAEARSLREALAAQRAAHAALEARHAALQAENEALRASELRYRQLLDNSGDIVYRFRVAEPVGYEYVNQAITRVLGYEPADYYADPGFGHTTVVPEDQAAIEGFLLAEGRPFAKRVRRKDGQVVWMESLTTQVFDEAGSLVAIDGVSRDVTEQVQAEQALRREKRLLEALVSHAPIGIMYIDRDMIVRRVNEVAARAQGLRMEDMQDQDFYTIFPFVERPNPRFEAVLERGESLSFSAYPSPARIGLGEETRPSYWDFAYVPVPGEDGNMAGIMGVGLEVTGRVEHERLLSGQIARLRELDMLKDQFLGILSHELRTPLNAITGFASITADGLAGPLTEAQDRYLDRIMGGADVLLRLIDDLLDMSRIRAGKFTIAPGPLDPGAVAAQVVADMRPLSDREGHALLFGCDDGLPTIEADPQRVAQVLRNLIGNAIKFMPAGGAIAVRVLSLGAGVRIEVQDEGPGLDEAQLALLFQPFTQLDAGPTRPRGGAGLGLSIARALVEAHGGLIGVQSAPGAGSTFWFELPAAPPAVASA